MTEQERQAALCLLMKNALTSSYNMGTEYFDVRLARDDYRLLIASLSSASVEVIDKQNEAIDLIESWGFYDLQSINTSVNNAQDEIEAAKWAKDHGKDYDTFIINDLPVVLSAIAKQTNTPVIEGLLDPDMPDQELRLHMGEMTAQEMRTARAAIRWANTRNHPKMQKVDLDTQKYRPDLAGNRFVDWYNRAIDDIKFKWGELYAEADNRFLSEAAEVKE